MTSFVTSSSLTSLNRLLSNITDSCLGEIIALVNHKLCSEISDL